MSEIAVRVSNLGKRFQLGLAKSGDFRENFGRRLKHLVGKTVPGEEFWALKDISFEIKEGQAVGIIGKNGAGKSTLLKILSRITEPTKGRIEILGRVSSLLEVGTGFHPELTGRENIFLNGTILGMSRSEVKSKFEEIVDFSGIEEFIDTPVKRYSSGMSVRLAFSVAAHLEPEVMIIDEVLAVGDADFQKKCIGKMSEVTSSGRTIIFVSHNMGAVQSLCDMGILIKDGLIASMGDVQDCIHDYFKNSYLDSSEIPLLERTDRKGSGEVKLDKVELLVDGAKSNILKTGADIRFRFWLKKNSSVSINHLKLDVAINGSYNEKVSWCTTDHESGPEDFSGSRFIDLMIPKFPLNQGRYSLTLFLMVNGGISDWIKEAFYFDVESGDFYENGMVVEKNKAVMLFDYKMEFGNS